MINLYKPNSKGTGCSFSLSLFEDCFGMSLLKQARPISNDKKGTFAPSKEAPDKNIFIKISAQEAATIIDGIKNNRPVKFFHDSIKKKASINIEFSPYITTTSQYGPGETKQVTEQKGFSLKIVQTPKTDSTAPKSAFLIGFNFGEAEYLKRALIFGLNKIFSNEVKKTEARKIENAKKNAYNSVNG